jgi:hypothetical protein
MIRHFQFANEDISKERFEYIFHGLIIMGNQNTQKGLSVLNREISLLDKIEKISKPCECGKMVAGSQEPDRELVFNDDNTSPELVVDDAEFDILFDYVSKVPWSIGKSSRGAISCLNWMKNGSPAS